MKLKHSNDELVETATRTLSMTFLFPIRKATLTMLLDILSLSYINPCNHKKWLLFFSLFFLPGDKDKSYPNSLPFSTLTFLVLG